jgi:hypothetical protein
MVKEKKNLETTLKEEKETAFFGIHPFHLIQRQPPGFIFNI